MLFKDLHYGGLPVSVSVKIHNQDVTSDLASVDDIGQGIDYPNLTEFRVGECAFIIRDVTGDFSPNNASNFFTQHGGQRTGRNSPVEIEAGFIVDGTPHTATVFKGNIIRLVQDATGATVKVVCTDNFGDMRKKTIADFGIPRHFMLTENLEQVSAGNGAYPIMDAVLPASDGSVSLATRVGETIQPVQKLQTEGTLNPRNFIIDREGVSTEGGPIVNRGIGYPQIKMKSPYRYRHIKDVITDILNHAGISDSEINIPEQAVDAHFSSNGRVNYDLLGNIGSGNPVTWNGYVTDFLQGDVTRYSFPATPADHSVVIFCNAAAGLENYFERAGNVKTTAIRGEIAQYDAAQSRWEHHGDLIANFGRINTLGEITIIATVGDIPASPNDGDTLIASSAVTVASGIYVNVNGANRTTINKNVVAQWVASENRWQQRGNIQNIVTTLGTISGIYKEVQGTGTDKWYFLYNGGRNNPNGISQIIVYDVATRTYSQLHKFSSAAEVWKFTKSENNLYILANSGSNYDANEISSQNQIIQLDISGNTPTETVFVPHANSLRPQLSHYYAGVGSIHHLPDSRRKIIYRENDGLYYAFVDSTNSTFGIAKATAQNTTEAVITINPDNHGNHAGITFSIDTNGTLKGATTFVSGGKSQILVFKKAL